MSSRDKFFEKGEIMDKKKKAIIAVIVLIVLLVILGVVWFFVFNKNGGNGQNSNNAESSKVSKLYEILQADNSFSFELTLDDENYMYYAKSNDMAYTDTSFNGKETKYIIKDGNSYLLQDDTKTYYTYSNNQTNLNMVIRGLEEVKDLEYETGREELNNKNYSYEEYSGLTDFAMGDFTEDSGDVKTRFYFDGDKLVYIKTIEGDKQELLKVNISNDVDQKLFQIPSDYSEA